MKKKQNQQAPKKKAIEGRSPEKKKSLPFSASEHARLFHSIFYDSDEAKEHLDLLMTCMARQKLDANDPKNKTRGWVLLSVLMIPSTCVRT